MRPKSNVTSRLAAVKDLKRSPALLPDEQQFRRQRREESASKVLEYLAAGEFHDGHVGGLAADAFLCCAANLIVEDQWTPAAAQELALAIDHVDVLARWHAATGSPKHGTHDTVADHAGTALTYSAWACFICAYLGRWEWSNGWRHTLRATSTRTR